MAKQQGIFKFTGTIQNVTGYEMNGRYYIKAKSEIARRRIRYDPCFSNTRRAQRYFSMAQNLAREVYSRHMRLQDRFLKNWYRLRNRAQQLLRTDMPREQALEILVKEFVQLACKKNQAAVETKKKTVPQPVSEVQLGRAYGRIDPPEAVLDQLTAINLLMQQLLQPKGNITQQPSRFKETNRVRRE